MKKEIIDIISTATRAYSTEREVLAERVNRLHHEIEAVKRRLLPGIKSAAAKAQDAKDSLAAIIELNPEAFDRPRSITISGIKVGLQKQKGKVTWDKADAVVKAIRRHLPERFDDLVETVEKPRKSAINNLTVAEARKLGCTVTEDTDAVLIKATGDDIDKIVAKILEEDTEKKEAA
jgi:hypothetical protein